MNYLTMSNPVCKIHCSCCKPRVDLNRNQHKVYVIKCIQKSFVRFIIKSINFTVNNNFKVIPKSAKTNRDYCHSLFNVHIKRAKVFFFRNKLDTK